MTHPDTSPRRPVRCAAEGCPRSTGAVTLRTPYGFSFADWSEPRLAHFGMPKRLAATEKLPASTTFTPMSKMGHEYSDCIHDRIVQKDDSNS